MEKKNQAAAHKLVADVARGIADTLYEEMMKDNVLRRAWVGQNPGATERELQLRWRRKYVELCIPQARATLTAMLRSNMDEGLKDVVAEALILDRTLTSTHGARRQ